jgi:hypothetical protein
MTTNNAIFRVMAFVLVIVLFLASCSKNHDVSPMPKDPNTAEVVSIDRFSATAGHLQVRTVSNGLPAANAPINFDQGPFITRGFAPNGALVDYFNFDLQPTAPAPIWVLFKNGESNPVPGQLNIIDVIPGEAGYNDFWQVYKVTVPSNYLANTVTSYDEIVAKGYAVTKTSDLVNCPVVPKGSTATKRFSSTEDAGLTIGWYDGKVVYYFNFAEKALSTTSNGLVPLSPIYVSFNINPGQPNGGPDSGFKMETGSSQTHNVIATIPSDAGYSPLWTVKVYDNAAFSNVSNLNSASSATLLVPDAGAVNCPVVHIQ